MLFCEWSSNFCKAARIDLKLQKLQQELEELQLKLERARLGLSRFDKIAAHENEFGYANFFTNAINFLQTREQAVQRMVDTDNRQANEYQKELKGFENKYFELFMKIAQEDN